MDLRIHPPIPHKKDYRIGILGSGFIMNDCHLVAYRKAGFNPVAIASRQRQNAEKVAARHAIPTVYGSYPQLLADPTIEILDIAVPPNAQVPLIIAACRHQTVKGILAQKPLGLNYAEAVQAVEACEQAGITLAVNQNMRYDQSVRAVKTLLDQGTLGTPVLATIELRGIPHWMPWQAELGWVTLRTLSIHHLDTFRYWFGDPERIYCSVRTDPRTSFPHTDGIATYILEYVDGLRCLGLDDVWTGPAKEGCPSEIYLRWRIEGLDGLAMGEIGWVKDPYSTPSTLRYASKRDQGFHQPTWTESWFPDAFAGTMAQLLIALETNSQPVIGGRDNLKTMALVEAAYLSVERQRTVAPSEIEAGQSAGPSRPPDLAKRLSVALIVWLTWLAWALAPGACGAEMARRRQIDFVHEVQPILKASCYSCHGPEKKKAGLRLDIKARAFKGGENGPVIVPGHSEQSPLAQRLLSTNDDERMPQKADPLSPDKIALIRDWIDQGALWPEAAAGVDPAKHWAYQPLARVSPPEVTDKSWVRTPIDNFILARLEAKQLHPNPTSEPRKLVRRAYFDLIGLPPAPQEVDAFVNEKSPEAYLQLIDRLLASPHYGERWARHWLDTARFGESHGFEQDYDRPFAYWYRDFVIKALNDDMPYDQFIKWQLAGDEFAPDNPWAMAATGFIGAGVFPTQLTEAEFEPARYDELDNMAATTGTTMLGLTLGCARCHDHKFDPIPTREYYRFITTFAMTIRSEIELDFDPGKYRQATARLDTKPDLKKVMVTSEGFKPIPHHADDRGFPHFYPKTYFLKRGDPRQKGEEMTPGFLQILNHAPQGEARWQEPPPTGARTSWRRRALANWITDTQYGAGDLLARVAVNRLWQHHFGIGIVATPNDFGSQGARPTHPELLDWLASDLEEHGWNLKRLHRLIMTSSTYIQAIDRDEARANVDPDNRLLWHHDRRRLEAEVIRDAMLKVSGLLDEQMFGPGTLDQSMHRRSIYFFIKRSQFIPILQLFDAPDPSVSVGSRVSTTIAPQALLFMNSPYVREYSRTLAGHLAPAPHQSLADTLEAAYTITLGRRPSPTELEGSRAFVQHQADSYRHENKANPDERALTDFCQALFGLNEFIYLE